MMSLKLTLDFDNLGQTVKRSFDTYMEADVLWTMLQWMHLKYVLVTLCRDYINI